MLGTLIRFIFLNEGILKSLGTKRNMGFEISGVEASRLRV